MMKNLFWCFLIVGFVNAGVFAQPELDTTFNSTGKALINLAEKSGAWNVAVQPDNKIVMVSGCHTFTSGNFPFCVFRLNQDGSIDTTFGNYGQPDNYGPPGSVITKFGPSAAQDGQATGIAIQSDGKIVITGSASGEPYNNYTAMVRLNGDGTLDTTFGAGGKVLSNITGAQNSETVRAVAVQPDGKIVITGDSMRIIPPPNLNNIWTQFAARFLPNGTLDGTFGQGGIVNVPQPGTDSTSGQSLAIQPDGKILAGGTFWNNTSSGTPSRAYYLIRLNSDGSTDGSWNTVKSNYSGDPAGPTDGIRTVAVQPDGRVVALGFATSRLFRFLPNGSPDTSFDTDGVRTVFLIDQKPYDFVMSSDGRITVVGMSRQGASWITDFPYLVERVMPDGSYDGTFGDGGHRQIYFSPATRDGARAVAFDALGRPVIAGIAADATNQYPWDHTIISAVRLTAPVIAPAPATITGRVLTAGGLPVSGITLRMTDGLGGTWLSRTNPFGYYQFFNVMSGRLYSIAVKSRAVSVSERDVFVAGDVSNFDFTGYPQTASKTGLTGSKQFIKDQR